MAQSQPPQLNPFQQPVQPVPLPRQLHQQHPYQQQQYSSTNHIPMVNPTAHLMQHVIPNQQSQLPQPNYFPGPQQQGTVYARTTPQQIPTVQPIYTELPRLKCTEPETFDGDELHFRNWNQGWQALVGNNPSIYNAEKLIQLKNAIKTDHQTSIVRLCSLSIVCHFMFVL
jgi:hypothetical protein